MNLRIGLLKNKAYIFLIGLLVLFLFLSCAVALDPLKGNVSDSDEIVAPEGYGVLSLSIPQQRDWTIDTYYVTATKSGETPVTATTQTNSVSMVLKIGTWDISVDGKDSSGNVIYQGVASATVTESGTNVQIGLLKRAGNLKVTLSSLLGYDIGVGKPGYIEKIILTLSKTGFPVIQKEINNFGSSVFFSGLAQGEWTLNVEGQARDLNPTDYSQLSTYTTYVSGQFTETILASNLTTKSETLDTLNKVSPVLFSQSSGSYSSEISLTLSCDTSDAQIYYSTDGSAPSTLYSGAIPISSGTVTVKAKAVKSGASDSIVGERTYTIDSGTTSTPQFNYSSGTYPSTIYVQITCSDIQSPSDGTIYYTEDGSTPTTSSLEYTGSITVAGNGTTKTIKAIAVAGTMTQSSVASATYTIQYPKVVDPVITPVSGSYGTDQVFSIDCGTPGATIYYTIDGSTPSASSNVYSTPFTLSEGDNQQIKAIGIASGYTNSNITTGVYNITSDSSNTITFTQAEVLIVGDGFSEYDITAGINWFGVQITDSAEYLLEWQSDYSGVVEMYENDLETAVTLSITGNSGTVNLQSGETYFIKFNSTYDYSNFQIRLKNNGTPVTTTTTSTTTTTTTTTTIPTAMIIHFKNTSSWTNPYIYFWSVSPGTESTSWPGEPMTDEGNGWYYYAFTTATSANVIFSDNGANQTADLSRTNTGWYDGSWHDSNPDGPTPPSVTATPAGGSFSTTTKDITLSYSGDGVTIARYTLDGSDPSVSGTNFASGAVITIGNDMNVGDSKTLKLFVSNGTDTDSKQYTFNKIDAGSGLTVYAKNYTHIHYWDTVPDGLSTTWPGEAMTDEGNGWYSYTITGQTSASIVFSNNGSGQTGDLSRSSKGWYMSGQWYDSDPEGPQIPVVSASPSAGTYLSAQSVTLSSTNGSGDTIYYTTDGSTPTTSSLVYSSPINVSFSMQIKALGKNELEELGDVYTFTYTIDPNADLEDPTITADTATGHHNDPVDVSFTINDNKSATTTAYYTTDGSEPTTSSSIYVSGDASGGLTGGTETVSATTTYRFLVVDGAGHQITATFYYHIGSYTANRLDPRQETIYFLLTSRWFDGDPSNSVGDEWCSYTEERVTPGSPNYVDDNGFTGPEDVTWRGDFKGLVEKMDYIKALGFTTIWITPIVQNRSPLCYHGYHAWDFTKEDARLVSPGYDFQRVIDEAHARDMKICLDIVINHSGRFGIKNFAEVKYNTDLNLYPFPDEWSGWSGYDESRYQSGLSQLFPNGWEYDGLTSPGTINGEAMPPYQRFGDIRPFTSADIAEYPYLATDIGSNGFLKYEWPCTESYCDTQDGKDYSEPHSLDYAGYQASSRRIRGHNTGFPTGSGSFDNYPDTHFDSCHEDCPDLNTENPDVQNYLISAYKRYIDMGVDMFRVDTVMHIHKTTLNDVYWPQLLAYADTKKDARGGSEFFIFGEVANFVCNPTDKATQLREQNYTWDNAHNDVSSSNHYLDGNNYRPKDYSAKAPNSSTPGHVSVIDMIAHNNFCNGAGAGYGAALGNDHLYNDATYNVWYADSHDYGPNKGETRYSGDFASLWSMLFTFRGIPVVYYGSEIRFAQGLPNDWPGGGSNGVNMSLEKTGRQYYGGKLEGTVTATDFGEYTASGEVATTLSNQLAQHLMRLNKIRQAVPALQMGEYSTTDCSGGWASFKRRYTGNLGGTDIDSFVLVGVGGGNHTYTNVPNGTYKDCVTGNVITTSNGTVSFNVNGGDAGLGVYVLDTVTTPAPGQVITPSDLLY